MKYIVTYESGATGCGWQNIARTVEEVKWLIDTVRHKHSALVTVFDIHREDYVYYKNCLSVEPEIDLIYGRHTDLRTKSSLAK